MNTGSKLLAKTDLFIRDRKRSLSIMSRKDCKNVDIKYEIRKVNKSEGQSNRHLCPFGLTFSTACLLQYAADRHLVNITKYLGAFAAVRSWN